MTRVELIPATEAHARELAPRMRAADAAEVLASGNYSPLEAALESVDASPGRAWAVLFDGELGALAGVAPDFKVPGRGFPWLLTTDLVERHRAPFWRACRRTVHAWLDEFQVLEQAVDARYDVALRWAARLGFKVYEPQPFGLNSLPFSRIVIWRHDV